MWFVRCLVLLSLVAFVGCKGSSSSAPPENTMTSLDQVKSVLEGVAKTGEIDSGIVAARDELEKMKATDAAKAEALLKDLAELEKLTGDAAKKKATEMMGKL